jgi:formylglycine-generating enzyme
MRPRNLLGILLCTAFVSASSTGRILDVHPANASKGEIKTVTLNCEGTSFTTDPVLEVSLFYKGVCTAESFTVLSDTQIEASFDFSGSLTAGTFSAGIVCESGDLVLEKAFTVYDPDINGDNVVDMTDHRLFVEYFLKAMPGYVLVPDLSGLSRTQAEQQISALGLNVTLTKYEAINNAPFGTVTGQSPSAGQIHPSTCSVILTASLGIEQVYIEDPGFTGYMSKHEITNAQYCGYLNEALFFGKIRVENDYVYGNEGTYADKKYFGAYSQTSPYSQIVFTDGEFTVRIRDGHDMSSYPAGYVSWYGAKAFCEHYGGGLPTEWQWQAAADYDGSYVYGCGQEIDSWLANYGMSKPIAFSSRPYTSPVGYYGEFGYGLCDMAGNINEWTDSIYIPGYSYLVLRGGSYSGGEDYCRVSDRQIGFPYDTKSEYGFRVVFD